MQELRGVALIATLVSVYATRICVWTGSFCDCSIDCSALCTAPGSCSRANCYSLGSSCCLCNSGYYPDGLVCTACGAPCSWIGPTTDCICTCDSACQKCTGPAASDCMLTCSAECKTCDATGCLLCYPNAVKSASTCVCANGFYGHPKYCEPCDSVCASCSGSATYCTSCHPPATLSPSHTCLCPSGFSLDASNCQLCDPTCATCTAAGSDKCMSCINSFKLLYAGPSSCVCVEGKYRLNSPLSCAACHSSCRACSGPTIINCMSCYPGAALVGSAPSACKCSPPYDQKPDPSQCLECHAACNTCTGSGAAECLSCKFRATVAAPPGECVCDPGFYPSPDASSCVQCSPKCQTCSGPGENQCAGCKAHAELAGTRCKCVFGYYENPDPSACTQCPTFCDNCVGAMAACILHAPEPSLSVLANNTLQLAFSVTLLRNLYSEDVSVTVTDSEEGQLALNWTLWAYVPYLIFDISVTFADVQPGKDALVEVSLPSASPILSASGTAVPSTILSAPLRDIYTQSSSDTISLTSSAAQAGSATSQASLTLGSSTSLLSGNPSTLWSMMNQLQLITYIPMTKIELPARLASTLASLNMNSFVYNPFEYVPDPDSSCTDLPDFMQHYGVGSQLFLRNSGIMFTAAIGCLLSFIPVYLLSKCGSGPVVRYFLRLLPSYKWGVFIRYWLQVYLDFGLYSILQVKTFGGSDCFANSSYALNYTIAAVIAALFTLSPFILLAFTIINRERFVSQNDPVFNKAWGALYSEFRPHSNIVVTSYYILFLLRRFLYVLVLLFLHRFPLAQGICMALLQLAVRATQVLFHVLILRPFDSLLDQVGAVLTEVSSAIVFFAVCVFAISDLGEAASVIEWVCLTAIFAGMIGGSVVSMVRTIRIVQELIKAYKRRMMQVSAGFTTKVGEFQPMKSFPQKNQVAPAPINA